MKVTLIGGPGAGRVMSVDDELTVVAYEHVEEISPSFKMEPLRRPARVYHYRVQEWRNPIVPGNHNRPEEYTSHFVGVFGDIDPLAVLLGSYTQQKHDTDMAELKGRVKGMHESLQMTNLHGHIQQFRDHIVRRMQQLERLIK